MAMRAIWKGFLKVSEVACPVALYTAVSTSERIVFNTVNRETGHPVRRIYVDQETGDPVGKDDQTKGYEVGPDEYVVVEPEEIIAAVPHNDKTLSVEGFIPCQQIDDVYFDRPYYLAPADRYALDAFALLRDGMKAAGVAALAHAVLFRRARSVLIRAYDEGLIATTLSYDYEVRSARDAFSEISSAKAKPEMLDLAKHILATKAGAFEPKEFEDRYEAALGEVVKAKLEGRELPKARPARGAEVIDLMTALRQSAKLAEPTERPPTRTTSKGGKAKKTTPAKASRAAAQLTRRRKAS
ncbi:Ku protein [Roseomonas terrae]|jgi:DNA end-binding protein Ku|uniref:Non-homologous end joining protein Ku n=1 Tax=Neoroseomonas terrae TaxID=424799 RepID=A0ABS5EBA2_9PROT|nr:Ku protein [Neoroseomonas terrae]MBR0648300.1 Ku protein [Neoroseomonas terrae]